MIFDLEPGAAFCLASTPQAQGLSGEDYRRARAQSAWAIAALSKVLLPEEIGACDWRALAARVHENPRDFLAALPYIDRIKARADLCGALDDAQGKFPQVVDWSLIDVRRITPVPPGHWLLLHDARRFRATLECGGTQRHVEAIEVRDGFTACFAPQPMAAVLDGNWHRSAMIFAAVIDRRTGAEMADAELDVERHLGHRTGEGHCPLSGGHARPRRRSGQTAAVVAGVADQWPWRHGAPLR